MMRYTFGTMEYPKQVCLGVYSEESGLDAIVKARQDPFVKGVERSYYESGSDWMGQKYLVYYAYEVDHDLDTKVILYG